MLGRSRPPDKTAGRDSVRKGATLDGGAGGPSLDWNPGFDLRLAPLLAEKSSRIRRELVTRR
jgi:hypothetical protein